MWREGWTGTYLAQAYVVHIHWSFHCFSQTMTFRDARNLLIQSHDDGIIDDEFILLYDANTSKNPEFPYEEYGRFDLWDGWHWMQGQRSPLCKKTCVFYAENNFHMQFSDKTAFLVRSWMGFEVGIAYALILTEHNKTVIQQKNRLYMSRDTAQLRSFMCPLYKSQVCTENNSYCYHVTANITQGINIQTRTCHWINFCVWIYHPND